MNDLYNNIIQATHKQFQAFYQAKYKKKYCIKQNYTVIASMGVIKKIKIQQSSEFNLLTICSGTKALPYSLVKQHQSSILHDLHAEILCIRSFRKLLIQFLTNKAHSQYFIFNEKRKKYEFNKEKYTLFMYTSQIFCGDCSINEQHEVFSGGRPLKYFNSLNMLDQKYEKNILRTKPGRLDLPISKRSLSLSCSDKIALYNILGVQGKHLFKYFCPIYIDIFVVSTNQFNKLTIQNGINLIKRISNITDKKQQLVKRKIFNIIVNKKQKRISNQFCINHPIIKCIQSQFILSKLQKEGFQLSFIHNEFVHQWINGRTGLLQGSSLKNYKSKGRTSSLSSQSLYKQIRIQSKQQIFKYSAIKERIKKLFSISTDDFKQS